jgi:hypothetical protein
MLSVWMADGAFAQGAIERAENDPACKQIAASMNMGSAIGGAFLSAASSIQSVWTLSNAIRGRAIEGSLGGNDFQGKKMPGAKFDDFVSLNGQKVPRYSGENFPVIDKYDGTTATSIKSMDLNADSYQDAAKVESTAKRYVDQVRNFKGAYRKSGNIGVPGKGIRRALIIGVPACPGVKDRIRALQQKALEAAIRYGKDKAQGYVVDVVIRYFI